MSSRPANPRRHRPAPPRGRPPKESTRGADPLGPMRIHEAALTLIDAHGLAAFSIRSLADALGVTPTAIYWHVSGREAVVSGAIALAIGGVGAGLPKQSWQATIRATMVRFRDALRRHPNLAPAVAGELGYNVSFDEALVEAVLDALAQAGFQDAALVDAFNVVIAAMCGFATLELSTPPQEAREAWQAACQARIDGIDARRYPRLHANAARLRNRAFLLRWSAGTDKPLKSAFEAWVDVLISGLEARRSALVHHGAADPRAGIRAAPQGAAAAARLLSGR